MAESAASAAGKRTGRLRRVLGGLLFLVFTLLSAALVCAAAVLLHSFDAEKSKNALNAADFEVVEETAVSRITPGESSDINELRARCGFALPYFPGQLFFGEVSNAEYGGENAVRVTMRYQSGMVIEAVCPAAAAPLIRRSGQELELYDSLEVPFAGMSGGIAALMAQGGGGSSLYFATGAAAYTAYAPVARETLYSYLSENGFSAR